MVNISTRSQTKIVSVRFISEDWVEIQEERDTTESVPVYEPGNPKPVTFEPVPSRERITRRLTYEEYQAFSLASSR